MFDIDGTLTDTMAVDVECYEAAIRAELGIGIPSDWPTFDEVTDASILATACERRGIPVPGEETQRGIAEEVGRRLESELARAPHRFRAVPGAPEIFEVLRSAGWRVAMATGAWRPSALVKLRGAGIPHEGVPLASASEHPARAEIIRTAVQATSGSREEPVVYLGDGVWDGKAAKSLGYGFVGVATEGQGDRLRDAGADVVIEDFSEARALIDALGRWLR